MTYHLLHRIYEIPHTGPCSVCGMGGCFPVNRPWPFPPIAGPTFPSTCPRCGRFNGMPF